MNKGVDFLVIIHAIFYWKWTCTLFSSKRNYKNTVNMLLPLTSFSLWFLMPRTKSCKFLSRTLSSVPFTLLNAIFYLVYVCWLIWMLSQTDFEKMCEISGQHISCVCFRKSKMASSIDHVTCWRVRLCPDFLSSSFLFRLLHINFRSISVTRILNLHPFNIFCLYLSHSYSSLNYNDRIQ